MKPIDGYDKLRGGYYTPASIADFIVSWALRDAGDTVLEPSCGDGSFLASIRRRRSIFPAASDDGVTGIELDPAEADKANSHGYSIVNSDFFTYYRENIEEKTSYDVIVGNPPFIRYQNFDDQYRTIAFDLMRKHCFHPNKLTNIWLPFLLLSCEALSSHGRIGMVIPAELFQVNYAAEARNYLSSHFDLLTIITFKRLVFDDIQQEVVLLLGEKTSDHKGIRVVELDDLDELIRQGPECLNRAEAKALDHSRDKWVKYYLTNEELQVLRMLNYDRRISNAIDLYEINVGLVSGENDFFLSDWNNVVSRGLQAEMMPIISRAEQVKGIYLSEEEYQMLRDAGKRVSIFMPGDLPKEQLSENAQSYISWGEQQGFNKNYKCRIRKRWYVIPTSWTADAFLIRQANLYPKMILNPVGALVTDTLHKVRFHKGIDRNAVAAAFLNTYTLALSETLGRSYGGGVLTFEPGEMRQMRIPMIGSERLDIQKIDSLQRAGRYEEILSYTDAVLLVDGLGLSSHEVAVLHSIWNKMRDRRLARKQSI